MSNQGEVFTGGATTSQHVDAEDDDHFQNTTFKLKRTRSLGLLDEFIDPSEQEKKIEAQAEAKELDNAGKDEESSQDGKSTGLRVNTDAPSESNNPQSPTAASTTTPTPPFLTSPELIPHDDTDVSAEPSRHVDYLSHQWDVADISKSWRYVISRRKSVANAARLENASWRTWAQRRSNLKTISPEAVNWSKESDVTWLYGPILDDDDHDHGDESRPASETATNAVAGDVAIARRTSGPKPILKKRTVEDMMISHLNLRKLEIASARADQEQSRREEAEHQARREAAVKAGVSERPPEYFDYNAISAKLNSQYKNFSQNNSQNNSSADLPELEATASHASDHSEASQYGLERLVSPQHDAHASPLRSSFAHSQKPPKQDRHVRFNGEVRQCMAISDPSAPTSYYADSEDEDEEEEERDYNLGSESYYEYTDMHSLDSEGEDDDDDDDDDEEGGFFLKVPSSSSASHHPGLYKREDNKLERKDTPHPSTLKRYSTIELLPSTTLNYGTSDEESDDENPYTSSLSHNVGNFSNRGYDYHYDYNTVYQVDPNHAIYGSGGRDRAPDVVDVPENIALGSNFDYEIIENEDIRNFDNAPLDVINCGHDNNNPNSEKLPISSLDDSAAPTNKPKPNPFSLDEGDSSSDSDSEEEGLSISARNSSSSLAQLVFGGGMTATENKQDESNYPEHINRFEEPLEGHISEINPRYSSTSLLKQPHSSSSLSGQFFSGAGGLSKTESRSEEPSALSDMFFNPTPNNATQQLEPDAADKSRRGEGATLPPLQRKASPLPPHTTSENAFLGKASPPSVKQPSRGGFVLESDSDSDSEVEDARPPSEGAKSPDSYSSLYKVAGENGLNVSSSDSDESNNQRRGKGLGVASFLGSWNKNSS